MIARFRVRWRAARQNPRIHAILLIEQGRLNFSTLCGLNTAELDPSYRPDAPECSKCARQLEPVLEAA